MTFPDTPLPVAVELDLGGTWTDISSYVLTRDSGQISITRGRQDEASAIQPGACTLQLNNRDGRFSPRNPNGPYYGLIGRNTPIRVSVDVGTPVLDLPLVGDGTAAADYGYASTPDTAVLDITGDIDVRVGVADAMTIFEDLYTHPIVYLAGKRSASAQSWMLSLDDGQLKWEWVDASSTLHSVRCTKAVPLPAAGPFALRATHQVNNGAGGTTVAFYLGESVDGPWTLLDPPTTSSGTTSILSTATPLVVGAYPGTGTQALVARVDRFAVYSGINGTLVADPDFTAQAVGATTFTDSAGLTWTVSSPASITNRRTRFYGEVPSWPTSWTAGGADQWIDVQAAGILRRLNQGAAPISSALYRSISSYTSAPVLGYWPLEDGSASTQAGSALPGGDVGLLTGAVKFAQESSLPSSDALPTFGTSSLISFDAADGSSGSGWWLECVYKLGTLPASGLHNMVTVRLTGTAQALYLQPRVGAIGLQVVDEAGANLISVADTASSAVAAFASGSWARLVVDASYSGGSTTITVTWHLVGTPRETYYYMSAAYSGTPGHVAQVALGAPDSAMDGMAYGHLGVFDGAYPGDGQSDPYWDTDNGWSGEGAHDRYNRLCTEQGVPRTVRGTNANSENVGPQRDDTFLNLLQAVADADAGVLLEQRSHLGLQLNLRASMYNQQVGAVLPFTGGGGLVEPLTPVDDDQLIRNDVTVTRQDGGSATAVLTSGSMSTAAPPDGVGTYSDSLTRILFEDTQCAGLAQWLVYLGTWDEPRWPTVKTLLQNTSTDFQTAAAELDIGSIIKITDMPINLSPDDVLAMIQGYTETLSQYAWEITWNCSPGQPWYLGTADDPVYGRADTDGATLAAALAAADTEISLATTTASSPPWTTSGADLPFDVLVAGERMTVLAAGTVLSLDPGMTDPAANWKAQNGTTGLDNTHRWSPSLNATLGVPNGSSASGGILPVSGSAAASITPGATYRVGGWVYSPQGWSDIRPVLDWYSSTGGFLSTGGLTGTWTLTAGQWTYLTQDLVAPSGADHAYPRMRWGSTPPASVQFWVQDLQFAALASISASSPQPFTVVRSVNGIVKAQSAGAPVALAYPAYAAL